MANSQDNNYWFNGINKKLAEEKTSKTGNKFYNVAIPVPYNVSRNGLANIAVNKIFESKSDPEKINVSVNKTKFENGAPTDEPQMLKVNVCKFYDKDNKSNNKYETVSMSSKDLYDAFMTNLKERKEAREAKESEAGEER